MISTSAPVLYLCYAFPVVSETFVSNQVEALLAKGVNVKVLALVKRNNEKLISSWNTDPNRKNALQIMYPQGISAFMAALSLPRTLGRIIVRPASWKITLHCLRHSPVEFAQASLAAAWLAKHSQKGALIICHFGTMGYVGALLRGWGCWDLPQITVFHGFDISRLVEQKIEGFYKPLFAQEGHTSLTITSFWQNRLRQLGDASPQLVKLGVDLTKFDFRARSFPQKRPVKLISVGRLTEKKGYAITLKALANLPKSLAWEYAIVGGGDQEAFLRQQINELDLSDKVTLYGALPHDQTRLKLAEADAFVLASHTAKDGDMEALPIALLEAAAVGLPVVTSTHSAIPEFFRDGENSLVAEEGDDLTLSQKLETLLTQPALWSKFTTQARADMENKQDFFKHLEALQALFQQLQNKHNV
ncbi:MAG: colanic acid biosynthesis glycosyltransferase WcaL [Blastochloris viridis]|uniref:Colanic acid biosynthesis glycosyltransferase WcaL n=1 Tax=Blastochloris viridis TaxID=1079 RepID=A0A6N4RCF0_BLAVI|nr:MAG: colanic acid biosynthesis glycosyltransferase WcaL [Blastochloris viridis]